MELKCIGKNSSKHREKGAKKQQKTVGLDEIIDARKL